MTSLRRSILLVRESANTGVVLRDNCLAGRLNTQGYGRKPVDSELGNWCSMYKYGNHLTPGLTEVRVYAAGFTSFLAGFFRAGDLAGIPALKTW